MQLKEKQVPSRFSVFPIWYDDKVKPSARKVELCLSRQQYLDQRIRYDSAEEMLHKSPFYKAPHISFIKFEFEVVLMNFTLVLSLLNIVNADLISWNRQYAVSAKSSQAEQKRAFASYTGQIIEHLLKNGNTRDAKRLMYILQR